MVPCKSTAEEVSFEWSHHRISSTDSKVRTTLHVSILTVSEKVKSGSVVLTHCAVPYSTRNAFDGQATVFLLKPFHSQSQLWRHVV